MSVWGEEGKCQVAIDCPPRLSFFFYAADMCHTADYTIHLAQQVHVCVCLVGRIANFYIKIYYMRRVASCRVASRRAESSSVRKVKFVERVTNFN